MNSDGHYRPDILAPYTYLPIPAFNGEGFNYFGGTSGGATLIAGLCSYLFSAFPDLSSNDIRNVLIDTADVIEGLPAPVVNGEKAIQALKEGFRNSKSPSLEPFIKITDENKSIISKDPLERALALTILIKNKKITREKIWGYAKNDDSPLVKKVAIRGLGDPINQIEREKYWRQINVEPSEFGVKEYWAYTLLQTTTEDELDKWLSLVVYQTIDIWICINLFLQRYFPDAPEMEITPDPCQEAMSAVIAPVIEWYEQRTKR